MSAPPKNAVRERLDWQKVRQRLDQSEQALKADNVLSPERAAVVLRRRAEALAKRGLTARSTARSEPLLVFTLNAERYAVTAEALVEISKLEQCTPVPGVPAAVLGLISHRGELRAIIDLAALLGLKTEGDRRTGFVLLLRQAEFQTGFRVDAVEEISTVDTATIQTGFSGGDAGAVRFASGVTRDGLTLLDVKALLTHETLGPANRSLLLSQTKS